MKAALIGELIIYIVSLIFLCTVRVNFFMNVIRVLLVEDDQLTQTLLKSYLEAEKFKVSAAHNGNEMSRMLRHQPFDLIILDLGLPDEDGLVLIRQTRMVSDIPIVVVTSRDDQADRNSALELGADDYLVKPFDPVELVLRLQNILRRTGRDCRPQEIQDNKLPVGQGWSVCPDSHSLENDLGENIPLTRAEFDILVALARAPNRVLSRGQLLDATAHFGNDPGERTIDVLVGRLRRKLGVRENDKSTIRTVPGAGYMLPLG